MPTRNDRRRIAATAAVSKLYADDRARAANGEEPRGVRHDEVADAVLAAVDSLADPPPVLTFRDLGFALPAAAGDPAWRHRIADDAVLIVGVRVVTRASVENGPGRALDGAGVTITADLDTQAGGVAGYSVNGPGNFMGALDPENADTNVPDLRSAVRAARKILAAIAAHDDALADAARTLAEARAGSGRAAVEELTAELEAEGL